MKTYLTFGSGSEPRLTVEVEPIFNERNVAVKVKYRGYPYKIQGSGSARVGRYIKYRGERVKLIVSER